MTERKFTPPTEFPAGYVDGHGIRILLRAEGVGEYSYIGQPSGGGCWRAYTKDGRHNPVEGPYDLHDIPKKQVHWANDYDADLWLSWRGSRKEADMCAHFNRIAVIRREWVEGELPQYFTEEV